MVPHRVLLAVAVVSLALSSGCLGAESGLSERQDGSFIAERVHPPSNATTIAFDNETVQNIPSLTKAVRKAAKDGRGEADIYHWEDGVLERYDKLPRDEHESAVLIRYQGEVYSVEPRMAG